MQDQLDTIVIEGDSSVEAAQARVSSSGEIYPTLKGRLDAENEQVNVHLEHTKQELQKIETQLNPFDVDIPSSESKDAFINAMNKKAEEIGMIDTVFTNPHGMMNEGQVTTAKDMLLMAINALSYKFLTDSWSKKNHIVNVEGINARKINLETTVQESSLNNNYNVSGGKTGSLSGITQNLLSVVNTKYTNDWFIGCVMDASPSRYTATRQLFDISNTIIRNKQEIKQNTSNLSNGNFDEDLAHWTVFEGGPFLDKKEYYSFPQSLNVSGTSSQQIRRGLSFVSGNKYYVSAMVKCTRYSSGNLGVQVTATSPPTTIGVNGVTDGWQLVSGIITATSGSGFLYAGSIDNANLDGNVDMINIINLTSAYGAGKEPSKAEMDRELWRDVNSTIAIACQVPTVSLSFNRDNLPILFEKNADVRWYPASLTKVMTAIIMLDYVSDLNKKIMIIDSDITGGSGPIFEHGDIITLRDALYCMMLPSSNTAANAVARIVGRKIYLNEIS